MQSVQDQRPPGVPAPVLLEHTRIIGVLSEEQLASFVGALLAALPGGGRGGGRAGRWVRCWCTAAQGGVLMLDQQMAVPRIETKLAL